jgi:hypothetical protein
MSDRHAKNVDAKLGRFLGNICDPSDPRSRSLHHYSYHAFMDSTGTLMQEEWRFHAAWVRENVIGPPKAKGYTTEQLKAQGLVGLYAPSPLEKWDRVCRGDWRIVHRQRARTLRKKGIPVRFDKDLDSLIWIPKRRADGQKAQD